MRKTIDPVTLEVLYHRLTSIADEMELTLLRSSMSPIVKEARDASTAIFNAQGETVAQALAIPFHLGTLVVSVPGILEAFPPSEMREGDAYIANDPYSGGTHLPDITMVTPVIYHEEVVALSCSMVHQPDIGAMTPGIPTSTTSIYQEGLNLPPLKFYDAGKPVKVVHDIIRKNVRIPDKVIGDLRAQIAAGNVGKLRIRELFEEYGNDIVLSTMKELMDRSEALTRRELEKIPRGSYSFVDYMDNDGVDLDRRIKIQVTVTIEDSNFTVDFSGTDPQVRGPFNVCPSGSLAAAAHAIRAIASASIPTNHGCFRPIKLRLPEGSIVNPRPPAAVGARASTIIGISDAILGALAKAVPERVTAACDPGMSLYLGGEGYVTIGSQRGGQGARPIKDGIDVVSSNMANVMNVPVEYQEMYHPLRFLRFALRNGSGGAGKYRGGLGIEAILEALSDGISVTWCGRRYRTRPWGLCGGLPGISQAGFIIRKGRKQSIPSRSDFTLSKGDQLQILTGGGGGYGDPLERKPELVLRDVLNRRVSFEAATEEYGVVIDIHTMTIDYDKTNGLRDEKKRLRGPVTWTYDRGDLGKD